MILDNFKRDIQKNEKILEKVERERIRNQYDMPPVPI
jgi:hypothetical protein